MRTMHSSSVVHEIYVWKPAAPHSLSLVQGSELSASAIFMHAELSCIARLTVHVITDYNPLLYVAY